MEIITLHADDRAYHPHYRIIKREIFEKEILPLLK